jgi:rubredoxin/desulfoferrodoxin (superoxide reductase-like protein)
MKYHCTNCSYIYDETLWEPEQDIEAFTSWGNISEDFYCPICFSPKDDFISPKEELIYLKNNNLTIVEAIHYPKIFIERDTLYFEIWEEPHPIEEDHFVYKVSLYDYSGDMLEERDFKPWKKAIWEFDLSYLDEFEIRIYCNHDWDFSTGILER